MAALAGPQLEAPPLEALEQCVGDPEQPALRSGMDARRQHVRLDAVDGPVIVRLLSVQLLSHGRSDGVRAGQRLGNFDRPESLLGLGRRIGRRRFGVGCCRGRPGHERDRLRMLHGRQRNSPALPSGLQLLPMALCRNGDPISDADLLQAHVRYVKALRQLPHRLGPDKLVKLLAREGDGLDRTSPEMVTHSRRSCRAIPPGREGIARSIGSRQFHNH